MRYIDSHIHIGQYNDLYTTPSELKHFLNSVGVECFAVSSTTVCNGDYDKVISELKELKTICGNRMFPVMWITPQMLRDGGVEKFKDSGIEWKCLKIHPQLDPEIWTENNSNEMRVLTSLASVLQLPLLIHSGEWKGCNPLQYVKAIEQNPNVTYILAHGRPIDETIDIMKQYPNVWVDTAFMPTEHIVMLCKENLSDRVLWGTDYPIPKLFYPDMDMKEYYIGLVTDLKRSVSEEDFEKITHKNFERLFGEV